LSAVAQTGSRRKPLRWIAELESDYFFAVVNLRGVMLVRGMVTGRTRAILPRTILIAHGASAIRALLSRGEHQQIIMAWPSRATHGLQRQWSQHVAAHASMADGYGYANCVNANFLAEAFEHLVYWTKGYSDEYYPKVQGCLHLMAGEAMTGEDHYRLTATNRADFPDAIARLVEEVQKRPSENWTLKEAAAFVGYSPFHLSRTFKNIVGYGFPEYVERRRTELAIQRILNSNKDFDTISAESGFGTSQAFREAFRQHLGLLPSEVRAFSAGEEPAMAASSTNVESGVPV